MEFLEAMRWNGQAYCPHCGVVGESRQMTDRATGGRNKRFLWRCGACKRQFTVRVGSVFEDSRIPLRHWCYAFWAACSSKKGVSALQIKRMTGLSYKSALFMMHRIRFAMAPAPDAPPLTGIVEADETCIGGKPRDRSKGNWRTWHAKKQTVVGLVQRGGEIRPLHMERERVDAKRVKDVVMEHVHKGARLMTDESYLYFGLGKHFEGGHDVVKHTAREYARGDVTTNTIEGFFALLKRGMYGTFHSVSKRHLHRYLAEFAFRYNLRGVDDGERTAQAIRAAAGKRLLYREPGPRADSGA